MFKEDDSGLPGSNDRAEAVSYFLTGSWITFHSFDIFHLMASLTSNLYMTYF